MESPPSSSSAPIDAGLHGVPGSGTANTPPKPKAGLGTFAITMMVISAAAPLSVVAAAVPINVAVTDNVGSPLFYLISGAILMLFSVGFTLMPRHVKNAGAFYSYIQVGLGRYIGTGAATLALVSYYMLQVSLYSFLGVATSNLFKTYSGVDVSPWISALLILAIVSTLGYFNIELNAKVMAVLVSFEFIVVVVMNISILTRGGGPDGLSLKPFALSNLGEGLPALGLMFAIFGYIGFEATAVFRNEARDPDKTIPRATYISVAVIGLFYSISAWLVISGVGVSNVKAAALESPDTLTAKLAGQAVAPIFFNIVEFFVVTSVVAAAMTFHNVLSRYQMTLAHNEVLPNWLGKINQRHKSPSNSSITVTAVSLTALLVTMLAGLDPMKQAYPWFGGSATLGLMMLMTMTSLAVVVFFRRNKFGYPVWKSLYAPALAFVLLGAVSVATVIYLPDLTGDSVSATAFSVVLIASIATGMVVAAAMRRRSPQAFAKLLERDTEGS